MLGLRVQPEDFLSKEDGQIKDEGKGDNEDVDQLEQAAQKGGGDNKWKVTCQTEKGYSLRHREDRKKLKGRRTANISGE